MLFPENIVSSFMPDIILSSMDPQFLSYH